MGRSSLRTDCTDCPKRDSSCESLCPDIERLVPKPSHRSQGRKGERPGHLRYAVQFLREDHPESGSRERAVDMLRAVLDRTHLHRKDKLIAEAYFWKGLTQVEVRAKLHVSAQRVCRVVRNVEGT